MRRCFGDVYAPASDRVMNRGVDRLHNVAGVAAAAAAAAPAVACCCLASRVRF